MCKYTKNLYSLSLSTRIFSYSPHIGAICPPTRESKYKKNIVMPQLGKILIGRYASAPIAQLNGNNIL